MQECPHNGTHVAATEELARSCDDSLQGYSDSQHAMIYVLLLLLIVSREVAGDPTAYVGDPTALDKENYPVTTLLAALQDASVTNVVLVSNYRVGEAFHDATPAPLQIQRRVSLAAVAAVSLVVTDNRTTLQANHSYFDPCF